ncbi:MAG: ABC transporter permease [Longimicrobiales bacterium]
MGTLIRDLRYAVRALVRNRGFTLAALLTLALGIGANTAIFTVVNTVLLQPLPYGEPDRLTLLWMVNTRENIDRDITSYPAFSDWRSQSRSFDGVAAYSQRNIQLTAGEGEPEQMRGAFVTQDFFDVLGVSAFAGRTLLPENNDPGEEAVVVLSYALWMRRFGGDRDLIGRSIPMDGREWSVVGVMPPGFQYPETVELWMPLAPVGPMANNMESRGALWLPVIGRLAPGVTLERAQSEMTGIAARLAEEYPAQNGQGIFLEPLHESVVGQVRPALLVLLGAVAFVLMIACANVANLLLARGAVRRREISVRLSVGASGGQLARQLLTESMVLACMGGLAGFALAIFGVNALAAASPPGIPRLDDLSVSAPVIGFTFLVSLVTGLLFGLAPAVQAARAPLSTVLRDTERGDGAHMGRIRPLLVVAEIALALVLLVGAGLMIRTAMALQSVDPGFNPDNVLTVRVTVPASRYADPPMVMDVHDRILASLDALPGVTSTAAVTNLFLSRLPNMAPITMEGTPPRGPDDPIVSVVNDVATADYFETMGMRLVAGRTFAETDNPESPPVVLVNEAFVRQFIPDGNAPDKRFTYGDGTGENVQWYTIAGVIADTRRSGPTEPVRPEAYFAQSQFPARGLMLMIRTAGAPLDLLPSVRSAIRQVDAQLPLAEVATVEQLMQRALSARRFTMQVLMLFAAVAATLAAIGIYGVMAYLVNHRTREMGVRLAVGAEPADVVRLVLGSAARQIVPGLLIGLAGSLLLTRLLRTQLFGVSPTDPITYAAVALALGGVALLASWLPARRAARVDPMFALRSD